MEEAVTRRAELSREELYELVWSEPIRSLAQRYGISDVALAKTCRKHRVPRPPRGYWQRLRHGKSVRRTPLPKLNASNEETLGTVRVGPRDGRPRLAATGPVAKQRRYEQEHPITVPERIGRQHRLIREAREHVRRSRYQRDCLNVSVSADALPRALRILNTLIWALEERGMTVSVEHDGRTSRTVIDVRGTSMELKLEERRKQVERPASSTRTRLLDWPTPQWDLVYTGKLALRLEEFWAEGTRKTWADGKKQKLELMLNSFVIGLVQAAEVKEAKLKKRDEEHRRWEAERQRRIEEARRQRQFELRGVRLERMAAAWQSARTIRQFLAAARADAESAGVIRANPELVEWLEWAEGYALELDPLDGDLTELPRRGALPEDEQRNVWQPPVRSWTPGP